MTIPRELIQALPKTDLHCHLDGSLRLTTLWELACERGVDLGTSDIAELRSRVTPEAGADLRDYIAVFERTLAVLQDAPALERVAFEVAEDAHRENVRYIEVRFAPILHTRTGLSWPVIVEAVISGLRRARERWGVEAGVILCGIRTISPEASVELADLAVEMKTRGVVGFDLAGEERDYPAKRFLQAFYRVSNANLNVTVHAGESFGAPSIHQAIHYCGARRIGHGTHLREDPALLEYVNDHRIPLEMCLSSNVHTGAIASIADHPFKDYFDRGLRVTLNTDNRLISDTTVTEEMALACETFDLSVYDLRKIVINGFKSAFLPYQRKGEILRRAIDEMDPLFARYFPREYHPLRTFL